VSDKGPIHAVFDGIEEEDNQLPNWWLGILYTSIVFAFGYWFVFHTAAVLPTPRQEYAVEAEAQAKKLAAMNPGSDDALAALVKQEAALADGKATFSTICIACHGPDGRGTVGPNLTDKFWIHTGKPSAIFKAVNEGFPDKGMPPWGKTLGMEKSRNVTAFVLTLRNTNVAGGKPPQGEPEE
jgi:cytochrome c oxidase cbb3-type subunit III